MTSSALLARVALSTVILRPMRQVGCRSASASVACSRRSRDHPRNGPPECGEQQASGFSGGPVPDALQDRGMLAVDRHHFTTPLGSGTRHELSGDHERLLVGQRHPLAGSEARQRGIKTCRTDDRVQHNVHVGERRGLDETARARLPVVGVRAASIANKTHVGRHELGRLLLQQHRILVGGKRRDAEGAALSVEHAQCGRADGAGRAEHGHAADLVGVSLSS